MKISVVIPAFNEEKYIAACLTRLFDQIEKPDEVIVIDNFSTDKTSEIVKKFRVTLIEEKCKGIAHARDKGFNLAKGDVIARCDADSLVPSDWIKKIKRNFAQGKIDGLLGPISYYDLAFKSTIYSKIFIHFMHFLQGYHTLIGNNMAITKSVWQKVKNQVCSEINIFHEDIDLAIHVKKAGGIIRYDPSLVSYTSGRRIAKNPLSFFIEYPWWLVKTLTGH
ncbi:hypothetical protein A2774_04680 [Candidatus Roizmanbacteria bacterium RIFCSPHIGHO2_01_FULL_39_12c]|uniref:Glycosyltransferase 2-like domain-containing protein n=1 Tax=Candidatus Roizmanbacteria bacterium RIFCSPHIGHO2_01_FULL_39_12c TaxID=1802031 RepID=A0A1F7GCE2_9BACT|nr:MAG: hypothetical protein A2774_04680 [Candidatus Roizmanbacteria bacterium RIFCSPHIGHO2_01_FULL_39_12c]OGK47865.1 MAG: hypothetical protein A2963_03360 [Candidatus Roizmanbacteria bacterium RIFCSPLOWO2_01_FULL_40_13]